MARKNGGSAAAKSMAAKKDDAARKSAKKTIKVIKKHCGGGGDNNSGNNNNNKNKNNNCGEDDSAESHITQVMQNLASGPCWKMAKTLLSGLKFPYSKKCNFVYGFDDMCRVLLAACTGDGKAPSIDGQCKRGFRDIKKGGKGAAEKTKNLAKKAATKCRQGNGYLA